MEFETRAPSPRLQTVATNLFPPRVSWRKPPEWIDFFRKRNLKKARELLLDLKGNLPDLLDPSLIAEAEELDKFPLAKGSCLDFLIAMSQELSEPKKVSSFASLLSANEWKEVDFASHVTNVMVKNEVQEVAFEYLDPQFYSRPNYDLHPSLWEVWNQNDGRLIRGIWFTLLSASEKDYFSSIFPTTGRVGAEYHRVKIPMTNLKFDGADVILHDLRVIFYLIQENFSRNLAYRGAHILALLENSDEHRELIRCCGDPRIPEDALKCKRFGIKLLDKHANPFLVWDAEKKKWFGRYETMDTQQHVNVALFLPTKVRIMRHLCDKVIKIKP